MKHKLFLSVFLILVLSLALLTACGQNSAPADTEDDSAEAVVTDEAGDALKVIGIKAGSNTYVTLKNKTGQDIRDIAIKASTEEEYAAGLLAASDALKDNESRILYYTTSDDRNVTYDVQLSLEDGTDCVLHGFPFGDTESCTIWLDGVAYIDYLSSSTGNKESTRTLELNTLLAEEEGISLEELAAKEGSTLAIAATPSPSPSAAVSSNTGSTSGRTGGSSYYNGGGYSGYSGGGSSGGGGSTSEDPEPSGGGDSSGGDSSGGSSGGGSSGTIGGDEAYMDDDISGSTVG